MKTCTGVLTLVLAGATWPAAAFEDAYRHGRLRDVAPGVTLQRASESEAEEAVTNLPFLPGDRVWTDFRGRAEFQFADGSVVRLDSRSKLDYLDHDDRRGDETVVLSLWSGSLYLHRADSRHAGRFEIETPEGRALADEPGVYRVDVERGEMRLSVYSGTARLYSDRGSIELRSGERSYAQRGEGPGRAEPFDEWRDDDAFARWDRDQGDPLRSSAEHARYLPDELLPYAADFDRDGSWSYVLGVGYVWCPRVGPGWLPYADGRWTWTHWGWTWVSYERWGWAPYHYGRWGHTARVGWYWVPDRVWGPAWVSWAVGGDHIGWCPRGFRDRPIFVASGPSGRHGPGRHGSNVWLYARRSDWGRREFARRREPLGVEAGRDLRLVDSARLRLTRDLRPVEAESSAAPQGLVRQGRLRPSPADSVPELREDPMYLPSGAWRRERERRQRFDTDRQGAAQAERRHPAPRADDERERLQGAPLVRRRSQPSEAGSADREGARERERDPGGEFRRVTPDRRLGPRVFEPAPEAGAAREGSARDEAPPREPAGGARRREGDEGEVLRRFFQPLGGRERPAEDSAGRDAARERPRERGERESEPPRWRDESGRRQGGDGGSVRRPPPERQAPRPQAPRPEKSGGESARRRDRERD